MNEIEFRKETIKNRKFKNHPIKCMEKTIQLCY